MNTDALGLALSWLAQQREAMVSLVGSLVEVSSHTNDRAGVTEMQRLLATHVPLAPRWQPSERFGEHVCYATGPARERPPVVLVGHADTVFARERFAGFRCDGVLARGPGVLDMKGGLAVCCFALKALAHAGVLPELSLEWVVVSDEEVGSPDSASWLRSLAQGARAALVFEAGRPGDAIITRRKGTGSLLARAHGRAAHAGNAWSEGANAIWALSRWIDRAQGLAAPAEGVTVNVGLVRGGTSKNTVPDEAAAEVDLRYERPEQASELWAALREAAREAAVQGATVTLEAGPGREPLACTPESASLRERYALCQREAGLGDGEMPLVGGGSDAQTTASAGVPTIDGLGPRGQGFHTLDEQLEVASLLPKTEALVRFLLREA